MRALVPQTAPVLVVYYKIGAFPIDAGGRFINKHIWLSSEILPVMRINTKRFIMLCQVKRAPNSFVVKNIKIAVILIIMYQLDHDVLFKMGERTKLI